MANEGRFTNSEQRFVSLFHDVTSINGSETPESLNDLVLLQIAYGTVHSNLISMIGDYRLAIQADNAIRNFFTQTFGDKMASRSNNDDDDGLDIFAQIDAMGLGIDAIENANSFINNSVQNDTPLDEDAFDAVFEQTREMVRQIDGTVGQWAEDAYTRYTGQVLINAANDIELMQAYHSMMSFVNKLGEDIRLYNIVLHMMASDLLGLDPYATNASDAMEIGRIGTQLLIEYPVYVQTVAAMGQSIVEFLTEKAARGYEVHPGAPFWVIRNVIGEMIPTMTRHLKTEAGNACMDSLVAIASHAFKQVLSLDKEGQDDV